MRRLLLSLALAALPLAAHAQLAEGWSRKPTAEALTAAVRPGTVGSAVARCHSDRDGALSACEVLVERPKGKGLGPTLVGLAPQYRAVPPMKDGEIVEGTALIDASWPVPDTPASRATPVGFVSMANPPLGIVRGIPGFAMINCLAGKLGDLRDCRAVYEEPPELGFARAGLRIAPFLKFQPATLAGKPVAAAVTFPVGLRPDRD